MADDIVIGVVTYRRSEDGEWVEVISKACHTTVPDLVPFLDNIERLRRWKAEAIEVLNRWDAVAVMVPSRLGERKSETVVAEIERLRAEVAGKADYAERMDALAEERLIAYNAERALADQLAEGLRAAREAMCDYAGQGTGTDPETPEWQDYCISTWEAVPDDLAAVDTALDAWEEARRG